MTLDANGTFTNPAARVAALDVLRAARDKDESILDKVDALRRIVVFDTLCDGVLHNRTITEQTEAVVAALRGIEVPG